MTLKQRIDAVFDAEINDLWNALEEETRRQAEAYNAAVGDPEALLVWPGDPPLLVVHRKDGREVMVLVDRDNRALTEQYPNRAGAVRTGRPRLSFSVDAAGKLSFNLGSLERAAASLLRRLIE